jgi:surfeit locus 1 family protein
MTRRYSFTRPQLVPLLFIAFATALTLGLGIWQIQRLGWKEALIERIEEAQKLPSVTELPYDAGEAAALAYRNVRVKGRFLCSSSFYRPANISGYGSGFFRLDPLGLENGRVVLVNRGFISKRPESFRFLPPPLMQCDETAETVIVNGRLRPPYAKRMFTPENPNKRESLWFYEGIDEMEDLLNLPILPIIIDEIKPRQPGVEPVPNTGEINIRNDHLGYAVTWFLMAFAGIVMFVCYHLKREEA